VACLPALLPTPTMAELGPWLRCSGCGWQPVGSFWAAPSQRRGYAQLCKACSTKAKKEWAHRSGYCRAFARHRPPSPDGGQFFCMGRCGLWQPRAAFYRHAGRRDGVHLYCRPCEAIRDREWNARRGVQERVHVRGERCECGRRKKEALACLRCRAMDGEGTASILVSALRQAGSSTLAQLVELTGYTDRHILREIAKAASLFVRREVEADGSMCVLWGLA
jgi:hypothetical protein